MKKSGKAAFLLLGLSVFLAACGAETASWDNTAARESTQAQMKEEETQREQKETDSGQVETEKGLPTEENSLEDSALLQVQIRDVYIHEMDENYNYPVTVRYQRILPGEEDSARYPKLAEALQSYGAEKSRAAEDTYQELWASAEEMRQAQQEEAAIPELTSETDTDIYRADSRVLSLLEHYTDYWGGAHGYYASYGTNFDVMTGKKLKLADVVTDMETFGEKVFTRLEEQYPDLGFSEKRDYILELITSDENLSWVLGNEGITLYFNPYEIAAYADGMQVVSMGFSQYPELFKEQYLAAGDSWVLPMDLFADYWVDVDQDGTPNQINVFTEMDEYATINTWKIQVDSGVTAFETYALSTIPYIIKQKGRCYLYLFNTVENDYTFLQVFDLSYGVPRMLESVNAGLYMLEYNWEEGYNIEAALTDPDNLLLGSRIDCLSTMSGYRSYYVADNGMPVGRDPWFTLRPETPTLTLLKELEFIIVSEDGKELSKKTLEAGSTCKIFRTDNESFCDFMLESGEIGRVRVELSEWPYQVNGESADTVFDGMMYAG